MVDMEVLLCIRTKGKKLCWWSYFNTDSIFEILDLRNSTPLCRDKLVVVYTIFSNPLSSWRHWNCLFDCCISGRAKLMYKVCSLYNEQCQWLSVNGCHLNIPWAAYELQMTDLSFSQELRCNTSVWTYFYCLSYLLLVSKNMYLNMCLIYPWYKCISDCNNGVQII